MTTLMSDSCPSSVVPIAFAFFTKEERVMSKIESMERSRFGLFMVCSCLVFTMVVAMLGGCAGSDQTPQPTGSFQTPPTTDEHTTEVRQLRSDFLALRNTSYRSRHLALLRELYMLNDDEVFERLEASLNEAASGGGDGLEALLLAYVDALADGAVSQKAVDVLDNQGKKVWFHQKHPPLNMLEPLGRASSRMVIDLRPDSARIIFFYLIKNPQIQSLPQLLSASPIQKDLCNLPDIEEILGASKELVEADAKRQEACSVIGSGDQTGLLGAMSPNACLNLGFPDATRDTFGGGATGYDDMDRLRDMEQCVEDSLGLVSILDRRFPSPFDTVIAGVYWNFILGGNAEAQKAAIEAVGGVVNEVVKGSFELAQVALKAYVDELARQKGYERDIDRQQLAADIEVAVLTAVVDAAEKELTSAQEDLKKLQAKYDESVDTGDFGDWDTDPLAQIDSAKERVKQAEQDRNTAQNALSAAKAKKEVLDKKQESSGDLAPEMTQKSEACQRLFQNGHVFDVVKLGEDWMTLEGRLVPYINPDPDDPSPIFDPPPSAAVGLPICGIDPVTTRSACSGLIHCLEDQPCGCRRFGEDADPGAESEEDLQEELKRTFRQIEADVCAMTDCGDLTPRMQGQRCICVGEGEDVDEEEPFSPPYPLPIGSQVFSRLFLHSSVGVSPQEYEQNPMSAIVAEIVTTDRQR